MPSRVRVGELPIDCITFDEAIEAIDALVAARKGGAVFTPNVDHVVLYDEDPKMRAAYDAVSLSLVDGMPVLWASYLTKRPLPQKISGSDLVIPLVRRAATRGWKVYLLGGADGIAETAKTKMEAQAPGVKIVGTSSPRIDLSQPAASRQHVVETLRATAPDLVFVALGSPKQELWIHEARAALAPAVVIGVGASFDFIAGVVPRAPEWMSRSGLEWLYRLAREPRRLWRRYLVRDPKFALIVLRHLASARRAAEQTGASS